MSCSCAAPASPLGHGSRLAELGQSVEQLSAILAMMSASLFDDPDSAQIVLAIDGCASITKRASFGIFELSEVVA